MELGKKKWNQEKKNEILGRKKSTDLKWENKFL